jgi:transposase
MATVCEHLSVEELEERYVRCQDATASRHFQVIWLLARGHAVSQVSTTTAFGERWIEQLLARYNAEGPEALGDLRRRNGATATILKPGLLNKLRLRLREPPPDGGLWSSRKVAAWMAGELGLVSVAPQRGWEALKAIRAGPEKSESVRDSRIGRIMIHHVGWKGGRHGWQNPIRRIYVAAWY